jgi:hypothetical protein
LQAAVDSYDSQVLAPLAEQLARLQGAAAGEAQQRAASEQAAQQQLRRMNAEQLQLLQENQSLLAAVADRDHAVSMLGVCRVGHGACCVLTRPECAPSHPQLARATADLAAARRDAASAQQHADQLQGVVRSTGERAAAAEEAAQLASQETVSLQQQLADWKDR